MPWTQLIWYKRYEGSPLGQLFTALWPQLSTLTMASVFTNLTLRFVLLRIICCSTILQFIEIPVRIKPYYQAKGALFLYYIQLVILGVILVHHVARWSLISMWCTLCTDAATYYEAHLALDSAFQGFWTFSLSLWKLDVSSDLSFIILSFQNDSTVTFLFRTSKAAPIFPRDLVFYVAFYWTSILTLMLLALLRIGEAIRRGPRYLWTRYDITGAKWAYRRDSESGNPHAGAEGESIHKPLKAYHVLFGTTLWKDHFLWALFSFHLHSHGPHVMQWRIYSDGYIPRFGWCATTGCHPYILFIRPRYWTHTRDGLDPFQRHEVAWSTCGLQAH